jgi:hypothetical protein
MQMGNGECEMGIVGRNINPHSLPAPNFAGQAGEIPIPHFPRF